MKRSIVFSIVVATIGAGVAAYALQVRPTGVPSPATGWRADTVMTGFNRPWGMVWLPDGRMLVTEKGGNLYLVARGFASKTEVSGVPPVFSGGQGGLMDVSLHPQFTRNRRVYLSLSEGSNRENRTALAMGALSGNRLENVRVIWRNSEFKTGGGHFGSRILWLPDGTMLLSVGDGGNPPTRLGRELIRNLAQETEYDFGKVMRLTDEGRPAPGNPFAGRGAAHADVWSLGLRNIQGMARDPRSGRVYASDHGARGGDEVNVIERGKNYGWPLATFSVEYAGPRISDHTSLPGMEDPIVVWTPAHAPSGLAFYTGDRFPAWRGDLFSGGLAGQDVRRIDLDARGNVLGQQQLRIGARVRDVRQAPDGFLYLLTDESDGRIVRISPQ